MSANDTKTATEETAEATTGAGPDKGVKKALNDAKSQMEKVWNDAFVQLNARFQEAEKDVRDFVKKVESDGRSRLEGLLETVGLTGDSGLIAKGKGLLQGSKLGEAGSKLGEELREAGSKLGEAGSKLGEAGSKLGEETLERLGLVAASDFEELKAEVEKLAKKLETVRRKANGAPTKKALEAVSARVKALEEAAK